MIGNHVAPDKLSQASRKLLSDLTVVMMTQTPLALAVQPNSELTSEYHHEKWPHKFRQRVEGGITELNEAGIG